MNKHPKGNPRKIGWKPKLNRNILASLKIPQKLFSGASTKTNPLADDKIKKGKAEGPKIKQSFGKKLDNIIKSMPSKSAILPLMLYYYERYKNGIDSPDKIEKKLTTIFKGAHPMVIQSMDNFLEKYKALPKTTKKRFITDEYLDLDARSTFDKAKAKKEILTEIEKTLRFYNVPNTFTPFSGCVPGVIRSEIVPEAGDLTIPGEYIEPVIWFLNDLPQAGITPQPARWDDRFLSINRLVISSDGSSYSGVEYNLSNCVSGTTGPLGNPANVCLKTPNLYHDQEVQLRGMNFISCDMEVVISRKEVEMGITQFKEVSRIRGGVIGDLETPESVRNSRVHDMFAFALPSQDEFGYDLVGDFYLHLVMPNPNRERYLNRRGEPGEIISGYYAVNISPSQSIPYQIIVDKVICLEESDGLGSDDLALTIKTNTVRMLSDGRLEIITTTPVVQYRNKDVDSGESFLINPFLNVFTGPFPSMVLSTIVGHEVDSQSAYDHSITDFWGNFDTFWRESFSIISAGVGIAVGAGLIAANPLVGAIAIGGVFLANFIASLFYGAIAGPDLMIFEVVPFLSDNVYFLTHPETPIPVGVEHVGSFNDIGVTVWPQRKDIAQMEYIEHRRYRCEEEDSTYVLQFRIKRR